MTGIHTLPPAERNIPWAGPAAAANTQIDKSRTITVVFDARARGPWEFKPAARSVQLRPGELIDPRQSRDVQAITQPHTFFEVGDTVPAAPGSCDHWGQVLLFARLCLPDP